MNTNAGVPSILANMASLVDDLTQNFENLKRRQNDIPTTLQH